MDTQIQLSQPNEVRTFYSGEATPAVEYSAISITATHESIVEYLKADKVDLHGPLPAMPVPTATHIGIGQPLLEVDTETGKVVLTINAQTSFREKWTAELVPSEAMELLKGLNEFDHSKSFDIDGLRNLIRKLTPHLDGFQSTQNLLLTKLENVDTEVKKLYRNSESKKGHESAQSVETKATELDLSIPLFVPLFKGCEKTKLNIELAYCRGSAVPRWTLECWDVPLIEATIIAEKVALFKDLSDKAVIAYK